MIWGRFHRESNLVSSNQIYRGGVADTRLEAKAKAKDTKKFRDQGQGEPFREQTLSRPRTGMLQAKDTGAIVLKKKIFFQAISKKRCSKKVLLVLELRSRGFCVQAYADDLAVLVLGADMLCIRGMAQKAINIVANWASEQELQFSSKKTEIVLFTVKRNPDLGFLSMNGSKLELSIEAGLLGVTLDSKLTWEPHITQITRKATTALMQRRQIVDKTLGTTSSLLKWIYTAMTRPIMSYAFVFWAGGLNKKYSTLSSEEAHNGAETCLPDDFISFSWHPYWCSGNFAQHNSH